MGEVTLSQCKTVSTWNFNGPEKGWSKANWSNGDPFNTTWQPDNISFSKGKMSLKLDKKGCPQKCDKKPYASGEYRTNQEKYHYGLYQVRMKPARGKGLMSGSFFTYTGTYGKKSHHEVDIEFFGKNCNIMQTNYYVEGKGGHEKIINLGFNACKNFHNYGFLWGKNSLVWYVNGKEVHRDTGKMPFKPGKLMVNLWPGTTETNAWLGGSFKGTGAVAQYDWIKYSTCSEKPLKPVPKKSPVKTTSKKPSSIQPLSLAKLEQSHFSFNGGSLIRKGQVYLFSADKARDPGCGILTNNKDLAGYKTLRFEIKGGLKKHGQYARLIVQVYDQNDSDSSPSVSLDPVPLGKGWQAVKVDLDGNINKAKKVQFLLATDKGSCKVQIRNAVFN